MIDTRAFLGIPFEFENLCQIYPPTVGDVVTNNLAIMGYKLLTLSQEDIEDSINKKKVETPLKIPTPLQFVLINSCNNSDFKKYVTAAFELFLKLDYIPVYENQLIILNKATDIDNLSADQLKILNEDNFFNFQNALRISMGDATIEPLPEDLNPVALRVYKAGRKRERAAHNKKDGVGLGEILCSICCRGIGITPLNIREISYASALHLSTMMSRKEKYQTDLDTILAGADPKKVKPKYWIREDSDYQEVQI